MDLILLLDNIRSTYNVGSILRSAEVFGVKKVICAGYTPYPEIKNDTRLPHLRVKQTEAIHKTALGAEVLIEIEHSPNTIATLAELKLTHDIWALEQSPTSIDLRNSILTKPTVLILGNEVDGVNSQLLKESDLIVEITQQGKKESLNVSIAAGIALFHLSGKLSTNL